VALKTNRGKNEPPKISFIDRFFICLEKFNIFVDAFRNIAAIVVVAVSIWLLGSIRLELDRLIEQFQGPLEISPKQQPIIQDSTSHKKVDQPDSPDSSKTPKK